MLKASNEFNNGKSERQITLKSRKEGSIYQRKRDRRRKGEKKGDRRGGREGERKIKDRGSKRIREDRELRKNQPGQGDSERGRNGQWEEEEVVEAKQADA